uniref:Small integral membrane protein 20 n=1 Tax=Terrapene triunguis TaxID=2587831 RepID=A0A674IZX8_9SAUR
MARISRTLLIFGGFVAVVGAAFYPIYFRPLLQVEQYSEYGPPLPAEPVDVSPVGCHVPTPGTPVL